MKETEVAIEIKDLHKSFRLPNKKVNSIKSVVTGLGSLKRQTYDVQRALMDINFTVKKGEFFGVVGRNGSGKSTLLKILAGIYQPTKGSVVTHGKLVPFIELGVGFNPELTGRDNVYLNGAMLGFTEKQVDHKYEKIIEFAELERFMDQKLKNYSSGMQVRLAFSVATVLAESDILLLDEVLAVGDADFQRKCFDYFRNLKKEHKTVVFVSHDMNAIREYCDRAVLIEKSRVVIAGTADEVAAEYTRMFIDGAKQRQNAEGLIEKRWGDGRMKYTSVKLVKPKVDDSTDVVVFNVEVMANEDVDDPIFGFLIKNAAGAHILGTNTTIIKKKISKLRKGEKVKFSWSIPNIFNEGVHYIDPAAVYNGGTITADWWEDAVQFSVYSDQRTPYIVNPIIKMEIK